MSAIGMSILLAAGFGVFAYSAIRRRRLMMAAAAPDNRLNDFGRRIGQVVRYVVGHKRMLRYPLAGVAHLLIFAGFVVLLLNTLILWGRGYSADFNLWIFATTSPLGATYAFVRDVFTVLVLLASLVFVYYRVVRRLPRLTLNTEGLVILGIIIAMMVADLAYEGGDIVRSQRAGQSDSLFHAATPFASLAALPLSVLPDGAVNLLWQLGFWTHSALVLIFLNLLPYGKHFHVITVLPNVLLANPQPRGRLLPIADIEGKLERGETLGIKTARDLSWKHVLDLYTCTECGRCSDHCPATKTGKLLSPKHISIDLRDHLYANEMALTGVGTNGNGNAAEQASGTITTPPGFVTKKGEKDESNGELAPAWIDPEALWACTTCGACEQECPVFISYIDKIVGMRRNLVMEKGEFPQQLQNAFRGLETVGNVYSFANEQRADWAAGLDIPLRAEKPDAEYLYWVGCSPSFDDRARKIARATAQLLKEAGVDFAILGPEERCTGDPARRAGNEFLFQMMAQANVETLNTHAVKKVVTTCPHCFNTLKNEYPDFGGQYHVIHHTDFLAELIRGGRLKPAHRVEGTVTYHDACYLGRHNDVYDPPREILKSIPGLRLVEPLESRDRGMCCGAGGAQMWKEEEPVRAPAGGKVNHERTRQLLRVLPSSVANSGAGGHSETGPGARTIASACPFCMTMLTDGLRDQGHDDIAQLDVAEILLRSVQGSPKAVNARA